MNSFWRVAVLFLLGTGLAQAKDYNFGGSYTFGNYFDAFTLEGGLPIRKTPDLDTDLSYTHTYNSSGTGSRTNQITADIDYLSIDQVTGMKGALTFWGDDINKITYWGPTFSYTRNWMEKPEQKPAQRSEPKPDPNAPPDPGEEVLGLTLSADLFLYAADLGVDATGNTVPTRFRGQTTTDTILRTVQFHPSATLEKPLLHEAIIPSLSYGYYFYSAKDTPTAMENAAERANLRFTNMNTNGISNMTGGFLRESVNFLLTFSLPWFAAFKTNIAGNQTYTDDQWSAQFGASYRQNFGEHVDARVEWSRTTQDGPQDFFTIGSTLFF